MFLVSFLLDLLYKIISAFVYSSVTNNTKSYRFPVCGVKDSYQILGSDYSIFQILKASISATSIRIGASKLHMANIGRNAGGAFEGVVYNVAK